MFREQYTNPFGFIRIGRIVEDLDALAGNIAFEHCDDGDPETMPHLLVTASVDRIKCLHRANVKDDMLMSGAVSWTGKSSIEIMMTIRSDWAQEPWLQASFTFVARDRKTNKAANVNPLVPETEEEKRLFESGETKSQEKKQLRSLKSTGLFSTQAAENTALTQKAEELATNLLKQASVLLHIPCGNHQGNPKLMHQTRLSNAFICQPQHRNMHGRVFGGFLMRRAYEIGFATAYMFSGDTPTFREVDEVSFQTPVNVSDLIKMEAQVLYTQNFDNKPSEMHVQVVAYVTCPQKLSVSISNTFYFTFALPKTSVGSKTLSPVLPHTEEEARAAARRMIADSLQESH